MKKLLLLLSLGLLAAALGLSQTPKPTAATARDVEILFLGAPLTDLKDAEIADVITYVRQSWTNDASSVSADLIKQTRAKFANRGKPWTAAELK